MLFAGTVALPSYLLELYALNEFKRGYIERSISYSLIFGGNIYQVICLI